VPAQPVDAAIRLQIEYSLFSRGIGDAILAPASSGGEIC
jgi:hypothetical protein